ncbi:HAD family hydrolase [Ruminococcus sp.]|uniref:HAD family hydrolase n=1 Tax=Ruminococcus sp. TaxID=41978 RepID=UPI0025E0A27E|nr:HAD family hydrolase [Ruminococcus sp.]
MKKLYIFDLDGTLVNSIFDLGDAMNAVLEKYGYPTFGYDSYKHFVGNGTLKLVERALPEDKRTEENIKAYHAEFSEEYNKRCVSRTRPYEGIGEVIEALRAEGKLTAVASNKPDKFVKYIVGEIFKNGEFDMVAGKKDGVPTKPAPDIIYNILETLGVKAQEAVIIGDSDVDVMTAKNSGLQCIGCQWGFRGREELERAGADFIAAKPADILKANI